MAELVVLAIIVFVATLGVMFGVPRAVGGGASGGNGSWPDVLAGFQGAQDRWSSMSPIIDVAAAVITLAILGAGISIFLDPSVIGAEAESLLGSLGIVLILLGLALLGVVTYLRVGRSDLSNAEAALIGGSMTGITLTIVILYVLIQQG